MPILPEERSHQNELENLEQGNVGDGNIWVDLNERRDNRQFELIQTVKSLREKLQTVRANNEQILKTQEEVNEIFLNKLCVQNLTEIRDKILIIQKLVCIRKKIENWKILKHKQSLFIMKLKVVNKKLKVQSWTMRRRNKIIRKIITIMMKLWKDLKILNPL